MDLVYDFTEESFEVYYKFNLNKQVYGLRVGHFTNLQHKTVYFIKDIKNNRLTGEMTKAKAKKELIRLATEHIQKNSNCNFIKWSSI